MRIGIDIDDTICRTTELVDKRMKEYAKKRKIDVLDVINHELEKENFYYEYLPSIYEEVEIKRNVSNVIHRLRSKGNKIYLISGRSRKQVPKEIDIWRITDDWLKKNNLIVDGIFYAAYGENKAIVCKREKIDLMIDDDPYNYKMITGNGGHCLLFDDREKYDLKKDYATNWLEVEEYIDRFRG